MPKRTLESLSLGEILKMKKGFCKDKEDNWKCNYCPLSVKPYCVIYIIWNNLVDILECDFDEETGDPVFDTDVLDKYVKKDDTDMSI